MGRLRRRRSGIHRERKTRTACYCRGFRTFAPLGLCLSRALSHASAPFLGNHEDAVDETPRQIQLAPLLEVAGEGFGLSLQRRRLPPSTGSGAGSPASAGITPAGRATALRCSGSTRCRPAPPGRRATGAPRPSGRRGSSPMSGSSTLHCSSVRSIVAASDRRMQLAAQFMSWRLTHRQSGRRSSACRAYAGVVGLHQCRSSLACSSATTIPATITRSGCCSTLSDLMRLALHAYFTSYRRATTCA